MKKSKKPTITQAILTDEGMVLVRRADGSYVPAEDKTDSKRLAAMKDAEIDYTDSPELDEAFWAKAELKMPEPKDRITVRIDHDILLWLKSQGRGYQTRINAILRQYMQVAK